jgi:hypothetical protein
MMDYKMNSYLTNIKQFVSQTIYDINNNGDTSKTYKFLIICLNQQMADHLPQIISYVSPYNFICMTNSEFRNNVSKVSDKNHIHQYDFADVIMDTMDSTKTHYIPIGLLQINDYELMKQITDYVLSPYSYLELI